jgi:hypothetical protein
VGLFFERVQIPERIKLFQTKACFNPFLCEAGKMAANKGFSAASLYLLVKRLSLALAES